MLKNKKVPGIHRSLTIPVYHKDMTEAPAHSALLARAAGPAKSYPNTLQRLAKHFWYTPGGSNILALADELEERSDIAVVCVTDGDRRPLGIIRRERLFLSLGKRFGREIMSGDTAASALETTEIYSGDRNILALVERIRGRNTEQEQNGFVILTDPRGTFSGALSLEDAADYMVEMTNDDIAQASLLQERLLAGTDETGQCGVIMDAWRAAAKGVGGDFYFVRKLEGGRFFAALCDVSGKGVSAALVVSIVWGFLRSCVMEKGLKDILVNLNASVVNSFHLEKYVTGFFLIYDAANGELHAADMGHAHTIFLRRRRLQSMKKIQVNLPVGVDPAAEPSVFRLSVEAGDVLLLYSDGIPEQDNPGGEEFGEERLAALLLRSLEQNRLLSEILPGTIEAFRGHTPQHDDMTFLSFRF